MIRLLIVEFVKEFSGNITRNSQYVMQL